MASLCKDDDDNDDDIISVVIGDDKSLPEFKGKVVD